MKLKNFEIKKMVDILSAEDSLIHNTKIKLPHAFRHVLRVNFKTLVDRNEIYNDEIKQIIQKHIDSGKAKQDERNITFDPEIIPEVNAELTELAMVENDLTFEHVDADILNTVLDSVDMSMEEDDNLVSLFSE